MREGRNESEAVRLALIEAGSRRERKAAIRAESAALAEDPVDRAELDAIKADFDSIGSEWPE